MSRNGASPTVTIPQSLAQAFAKGKSPATLERWAVEAMVIEAVREGLISRGKGAEILGFSFGEREQFYADHDVAYDFTPGELDAELRSLRASLGKRC